MNKTLNLLAILLILTCANSIQKISYSDIVSNLVQLSDDDGLSDLNVIAEGFEASNRLLTVYKSRGVEACAVLNQSAVNSQNYLKGKIENFQSIIAVIEKENLEIEENINKEKNTIEEEIEKIKNAKDQIEEIKREEVTKEKELTEAVQVLKRLKNLATDELLGAEQKQTEMKNFNVQVISFIQTSTFTQNLKGLMKLTGAANRGLISTLILLASRVGKQETYANPEAVRKIVEMVDKIIDNTQIKITQNTFLTEERILGLNEIIQTSRSLISASKEEIERSQSNQTANHKNINFFKNDIIFYGKALDARVKRQQFSQDLCAKQTSIVQSHYDEYVNTVKHIDALKADLSQ